MGDSDIVLFTYINILIYLYSPRLFNIEMRKIIQLPGQWWKKQNKKYTCHLKLTIYLQLTTTYNYSTHSQQSCSCSRDPVIWSRYCSCKPVSEGVPRLLERLVGVITIIPIITITTFVRLPIPDAEVVQEQAGNNDPWYKLHLHLQGFQKDRAPPGLQHPKSPLHHPKSPLHHTPWPGQPCVIPGLNNIPDRFAEWGQQANGLS